jgi:hypothetical protein
LFQEYCFFFMKNSVADPENQNFFLLFVPKPPSKSCFNL